jgi:hypothetical protein
MKVKTTLFTYHTFVFVEYLVIFIDSHKEDQNVYILKTMNPGEGKK